MHNYRQAIKLLYVIAWVAVKFGMHKYHKTVLYWKWDKFHEAKLSEIAHFQCSKSGIYPKFSMLYPC